MIDISPSFLIVRRVRIGTLHMVSAPLIKLKKERCK